MIESYVLRGVLEGTAIMLEAEVESKDSPLGITKGEVLWSRAR